MSLQSISLNGFKSILFLTFMVVFSDMKLQHVDIIESIYLSFK